MYTFKLWLEPDQQISQFKRLAFEKLDMSVEDVLLKGIHPWTNKNTSHNVIKKVTKLLNSEEMNIPELKEFDYCFEFKNYSDNYYHQQINHFEKVLNNIKESIFFVEKLNYPELLSIAKKCLQDKWDHHTVYELLSRIYYDFNPMRSFLKKKDKNIKLAGYRDIAKYDLSQVLTLDDFEGEEKIIISEGLPIINFRSEEFIKQITNEDNVLRLTSSISEFQLNFKCQADGYYHSLITYNCKRTGNMIRLLPSIDQKRSTRKQALENAEKWHLDNGKYCFTVDIDTVEQMITDQRWSIEFPNLNYQGKNEQEQSRANLKDDHISRFAIGNYINSGSTGDSLKAVLKNHGVSMTGTKKKLIDKLASLAASTYQTKQWQLDNYFGQNRFINVEYLCASKPKYFPLLEDHDLRNLVLAMYTIKHLRGNTILEASHCNNTYDLITLAKSLICKEVRVDGTFVRVNGAQCN